KPFAAFVMKINSTSFSVDNLPRQFANKSVYPVGVNGNVFVPLRDVINEAGGDISWSGKDRSVTFSINGVKLSFVVGSKSYSFNGATVDFPANGSAKPFIVKGSTLFPLDVLTSNFGESASANSSDSLKFNIYKQLVQTSDATGRKFYVPKRINKIVSLYPMSTQLLFPLNAEDALVASPKGAVINFDNFAKVFPKAKELPSASDFKNPNVETILSFAPDLVITTYSTPVNKLEDAGIPVALLNQESFQGMLNSIQFLGNILNRTSEAFKALVYINQEISSIQSKTKPMVNKPSVYFAGSSVLQTFGKDMIQNSLVALAGGTSVSRDVVGGKVNVSYEQILAWNPDFIVLAPYCNSKVSDVLSNQSLQSVKAVKNKNVIMMPAFILSYDVPAPESVLGVMWMANKFYPGSLNFNIDDEAKSFYKNIYSYKLTESDLEIILGQ
ncbi:MAG: ABC transporter substrate-binding protein, partial [Caldisericaceae bacterium]